MSRAPANEVAMRLVRADDAPAHNPASEPFEFGLQDKTGVLSPPVRDAGGRLVFDFSLSVRPGKDPDHPVFSGPFAIGPADDRCANLAWRSKLRGVWINRVKARLGGIDWALVRAAQSSGRRITADMTGRLPHGGTKPLDWRLE